MVLYKDELIAARDSSIISTLGRDSSDSRKIVTLLTSFNASTAANNNLGGDVWNLVREKFSEYATLFSVRKALAETIQTAACYVLDTLIEAMGDYDKLDSTLLPEIKEAIRAARRSLQSYENAKNTLDADGNRLYDSDAFSNEVSELEAKIEELDKLVEKIGEVEVIYADCEAVLSGLDENVSKFKSEVDAITVGAKYVYTPHQSV